jgi:hypothetical protein
VDLLGVDPKLKLESLALSQSNISYTRWSNIYGHMGEMSMLIMCESVNLQWTNQSKVQELHSMESILRMMH